MIINLARSMAAGRFRFSRSSGLCGGCGLKSAAEAPDLVPLVPSIDEAVE
jgi:hypothetical protein